MKWYISNNVKRKEKEKNTTVTQGTDEIKVMHTNIDGIITRKLELTNYLDEKNNKLYT